MKFILNESNDNVGFEKDEIFLLSIEEYKRYKNVIPILQHYPFRWWLRTPSDYSCDTQSVMYVALNTIHNDAEITAEMLVRPVLKISDSHVVLDKYFNELQFSDIEIGGVFYLFDEYFTKIDKGIAIVTLTKLKFDSKSNDYKNSDIRWWLKKWLHNKKLKNLIITIRLKKRN